MKLTEKQARRLQEMLKDDPDFTNISKGIEETLECKEMEIGQIITHKHCKHQWEFPSKAEIRKIGNPHLWGVPEDATENDLREFYLSMSGYCSKCRLLYRYKDVPMDEVKERLNNEFGISLHVNPSISYHNILNDIFEKDKMQTKEDVEVLEKEIIKLEKEIEEKSVENKKKFA